MPDLGKREGNSPGLAVDLRQRERSSAKVDWPSKGRLRAAYSDRGNRNAMVCRDFPGRGLPSCKHSVNGHCRVFCVLNQAVGHRWRRRRMHRRCIGCDKTTRLGCSPRTRPQRMNHGPINELLKGPFSCSAGIAFSRPGRALLDGTARKADSSLAASSAATRRARA